MFIITKKFFQNYIKCLCFIKINALKIWYFSLFASDSCKTLLSEKY